MKGTYLREATRRPAGAPTAEGGGREERWKACESRPPNVDIVRNVQSSVMPAIQTG
jgi:hypothetical protein